MLLWVIRGSDGIADTDQSLVGYDMGNLEDGRSKLLRNVRNKLSFDTAHKSSYCFLLQKPKIRKPRNPILRPIPIFTTSYFLLSLSYPILSSLQSFRTYTTSYFPSIPSYPILSSLISVRIFKFLKPPLPLGKNVSIFGGIEFLPLQFFTPKTDTVYSSEIPVKFYQTTSRHVRSANTPHIRTTVKASNSLTSLLVCSSPVAKRGSQYTSCKNLRRCSYMLYIIWSEVHPE